MVQHGEKVRSAGDPGLTEAGHRQAAAVAWWLAANRPDVGAIVASPLRRARETAAPIAAAFGLAPTIDARVRERMNWDDDASIGLDDFLTEWQRATDHRTHQPAVGDSSIDAGSRFLDAILDLEHHDAEVVVVVAHGGVTVDVLRTIAGDAPVRARTPTSSPTVYRAAPSRGCTSPPARSRSSTTRRPITSNRPRSTALRRRRPGRRTGATAGCPSR